MSEETVLPPAYEPFLPVLALLSRPMAEVLRGHLLQLEPLARGLERHEIALQGEFEGLGGLTQRGEIDHILQSELLLRTEAPLEFLRRLAETETLFHDRIFADPGARHIWRVIVSCGPDTMGHGRLLTLAALFFLARVAARRDAAFHWCFMPRGEGAVWFSELSVNTIKRFLRSAAFREANEDDVAEARNAWADATGESSSGKKPDLADWMIGSARDWDGVPPAVSLQRNALSFVLNPLTRGEPRRATISVRRSGFALSQKVIELSPDKYCLAALEKPFPIPRSEKPLAKQRGRVPDMAGWAPQYLSAPNGNFRAVRLAEGLLIIRVDGKGQSQGVWFLELPKGALLAGIAIENDYLSVLLHRTRQETQRLELYVFLLDSQAPRIEPPSLAHAVPSQHLFRNQLPHALPNMVVSSSFATFFSTSGQSFKLDQDEWEHSRFTALYNAPRILFSTGTDRIVGDVKNGHVVMQVFDRRDASRRIMRMHGCAEIPKHFHGIAWAPDRRGLAYSIQAGTWQVLVEEKAGEHVDPADWEFQVRPHEHVIAAWGWNDSVYATVWSDKNLGGTGRIESLSFAAGKRRRNGQAVELGEEAGRIKVIKRVNGQFWAVTGDKEGVPQELLLYRPNEWKGSFLAMRYSLDELRAEAATLEFGEEPQ